MPLYPYPHSHEVNYPQVMTLQTFETLEIQIDFAFTDLKVIEKQIAEEDGTTNKIRQERQHIRHCISSYIALLCCNRYYQKMRKKYLLLKAKPDLEKHGSTVKK